MAIVVKFRGGFKDGQELRGDSDDPNEVQQALNHYVMADNGTVGKRFRAISDAGIAEIGEIMIVDGDEVRLKRPPTTSMNHIYEVVSRDEIGEDIIVQYQYKGQSGG